MTVFTQCPLAAEIQVALAKDAVQKPDGPKDRAFHCTTHPEKLGFRRFEEDLAVRVVFDRLSDPNAVQRKNRFWTGMGIDIKTLCYEIDFCTGGARVRRTALPFLRFLFLSSSFSGLRTFGNSFLFRMDPPYPLSDQKPEVDPGPRRSVGRWPRRFGLELCLDGADRGLVAALPPRGLERSCLKFDRPNQHIHTHHLKIGKQILRYLSQI